MSLLDNYYIENVLSTVLIFQKAGDDRFFCPPCRGTLKPSDIFQLLTVPYSLHRLHAYIIA